jgi:ankyrin repeat protein
LAARALNRSGRRPGSKTVWSNQPPARIGDSDERVLAMALRHAAVNDRTEAIDWLLTRASRALGRAEGDRAILCAEVEEATPLHWCAWWGAAAGARALVERGSDPLARDVHHKATPREWAEFRGRPEMAALFVEIEP